MPCPVQAMILAAGRGTRLLPHTAVWPKPLMPVAGRPALFHAIDRVRPLAPEPLVVNCHHLAPLVRAALAGQPGVVVQVEERLLGTGGALARARRWFSPDRCLVVANSDVIHDIDLCALLARHHASGAPVSLVLHDRPPFNKVRVDAEGRVVSFSATGPGCLAFTGIHFLDSRLLCRLPDTAPLDVIDWYRSLIASGIPVQGLVVRGHQWCDIGTVDALLALHDRLAVDRPVLWRDPGGVVADDVAVEEWAVVSAGCRVGPGAVLRRAILLPGVRVVAGVVVRDRLCSRAAGRPMVRSGGRRCRDRQCRDR